MKCFFSLVVLGVVSLGSYAADIEIYVCKSSLECRDSNVRGELIRRNPYIDQQYFVVDVINNVSMEYMVIQAFGAESIGGGFARKIRQLPSSVHNLNLMYTDYILDPIGFLLDRDNSKLGVAGGTNIYLADDFNLTDLYDHNVKYKLNTIETTMSGHLNSALTSSSVQSEFLNKVNLALSSNFMSVGTDLFTVNTVEEFYLPVKNSSVFVKLRATLNSGSITSKVVSIDIVQNNLPVFSIPVINGSLNINAVIGQTFSTNDPDSFLMFFRSTGMVLTAIMNSPTIVEARPIENP